jgi:hypothetical protein
VMRNKHTAVWSLTNSMEQSPSEADSHSASQNIPQLLWSPKIHYRAHKSAPLVPILSHMNPVHIFPPNFPEIHSNVLFPSTPMSSDHNFVCIYLSHACYMSLPSHSFLYFLLLRSTYSPQHPVLKHPQSMFFP